MEKTLLKTSFDEYNNNFIDINFVDNKKNKFIKFITSTINTTYLGYSRKFVHLFFMLYKCIGLQFEYISNKTDIVSISFATIKLKYKIMSVLIEIYRTAYYCEICYYINNKNKIIYYFNESINFENEESIIKVKNEFSNSITWCKRLLPLYMSSDYASSNLLNRIPEDVSRYIISQFL